MSTIQAAALRWLALAAVALAAFGLGWVKGTVAEADKASAFKAEVAALGKVAASHKDRVEAAQKTLTQETDYAHQAGLALLKSRRGGLRHGTGTGSGSVPEVHGPSAEPGPAAADPVPAPAGTPPGQPEAAVAAVAAESSADLADACAETTLMFIDLLRAWHEQSALGAAP